MIYPRGMLVGKALLAVGILLAGIAGAIGASLRDDYLITKWETDNGLPENSATAMVQMPDGFLWFGTFNGLVRTDGEGFDVFRPFDTPELPGAKVVNLHLTGGTRLWVSTDRGLASLEQGVWRRHGEQTSWTNRFVRTFASGATGPLYLASFDGAVARVEGDELVEMPAPLPPGAQGAGFRLHVDETNGLWALRYDYFGRWNGQAWVAVAVPGVTNDFRSSFPANDGRLWVLTRDRLLRVTGDQVEKTIPLSRPVENVWSAREDADGSFWIASFQNGLYHVRPDGETTLHTMLDGLTYNALRFTLRDRAGTVWVGTSGGGLMRLRQRLFRTFGSEEALPVRAVKSVAEAAPGVMFLATYGSGLQRMDVTVPKAQFTTVGRGEGYAQCVLVDRSGRRWTGFYQTAASLTEGFTVRHLTRAEMGGASVTALFEDAAGRVWLGGSDRAMRFAGGQFEPMPGPAGLSAGGVRGFGQNPLDGSVWGATPHNLIQWSTNGVVAVAGPEGKAIANGNCLHFDADGTLWLGTEDTGLWCRREGKWTSVTTRHGLPANAIGAILTDAQGVFWIATTRGIVRATREALLAAAAGRVSSLAAHNFTLSDGLASAECPTGYQPTATRDSTGRLWFATLKGVALVNPADFTVERHAPHTRFTSVGFERSGAEREVPLPRRGEEIVLPPGSTHFGVRFAAPGAFDPDRIRYHVEWFQDGTVVAEEESPRRFARATLLPPGSYRVRVTAINHHGVRSTVPAELGFILQPHYWQTGWFRVAVPLLLAGLAGAGLWLKRRLREAREAEQKAHDLALRMEQARLASVMEGTTDAVAFAAPDLTLRYLNPAGLRMFGIEEKADLSQLKLREFYPMAAAEFMRGTAFPTAIAEGTWSGEILMVRRDGKELPVSQVLIAHYVGGEIQFYSSIIRNLSERKASEEALAAALKHARLLSELGRSLTEATTAPEAARLVMEAADELMHWDCAWVRLWREEKYRFERVYGYDTVDGLRKEFESTTGALDVGSPLVREVVVGGPKLILRRTEDESVPGLRPFGGDRRSLSLMFVPMRHAGKVVGVISVQSYRADAFNSTHLGLLQSLADHCAGNIERIDAERALRVSENRWRMAMAVAKFGTWDWDFTTQEVVASSELPAMFGGPGMPTLTVEKDFRQFIHPEDRAQVDAAITTAIQLRGAFHSEFRVLWLDGTVRWIEGRGEVFCLATGEPDRMVGVSTDITERKLAEHELRQSRILLDRAGRVAGVGGWHLNLETQQVWWSDETCRIHGLPPGHVPSLDDAISFYAPEAQPIIRAAVEQGIREGKPWDLELPFRTADGRDRIVRAIGEAEFVGGKAVGLIGGFQDITERKKLEAREAQRLVRLREQSRLIQDLATSREVVEGNVARAAALIAEKLAQFLGVERVSVWLLDATGQSLECVDLFERTPARHTQATRLEAGQFPRYFAALASGRILDAVDAATDPRTAEFAEVYLKPTNIHSMLDAGLRVEGRLVGVLCIESVGQRREWDLDETACAAAAADQLALAIAHRDRRAVEDRFRNLVECMAEGLLMTDFEDTIQFANRRVTEILGYSTEELVGRKGYEVFMLATQRAEMMQRNVQRRAGQSEIYELPLRHKDGRTVWVEVSAGPFRDGAGNVIGTLGAITDITSRRAAKEQLELLSQTLKSTRDCVAVADLEDRLLFVNDAFLTTYGYTREEIVGGPTARLRAARQPTGPVPDIRGATLKDGGWHGELMNARKDGTEFPVELWTSVVRDDTGTPVATVGVARDITERRKLEAQFRQSQKMEGIGQLAGGVAHDFNNLLTVIQGHVSLLLEQAELTSLARESVSEIGGSATRAAELTRQLLTFSRRQPLRMAAHDLNHVVPGVSRLFQRLVGEHIVVDIRPALQPVNVRADSGMIEQALLNLVVNARDAMPAGGRIVIETGVMEIAEREAVAPARPGHFAMLTVSDSGHGIPPEVLPHIFEPFFTTKDVGQGTGLGLATVFSIMQQHQGWITVASSAGQGTVFRLFLPLHVPDAPGAGAGAAPAATARGGGETILVVEDEAGVRSFVTKVLGRFGYHVIEAASGRIALEIWAARRDEIRLVITDMVMPDGVSGKQLAEKLQADRPELPIIFTSGYSAEMAGRDLTLEEGANFLTKPFDMRALADLVRKRLDTRS